MADKIEKPDDATSKDEAFPKADPKLNPRNQAFDDIAKAANERADADAKEPMPPRDGEAPPSGEEQELSLEEAGAQANAAAEAEEKAEASQSGDQAPQSGANAVDPNAFYDVTVDGQKMKVKGQKIIDAGFRTFQKETAADYRLQLATKMLEDARHTVSALPGAQAQPSHWDASQSQQVQQQQQIDPLQLAELIQFGTKEQAAQAIALLQQRDPMTVTQEGLQQFMMQHIPQLVNAQITFRDAVNFAKSEYGDLLKDPYLRDLFVLKEDQLRKAGDRRAPHELYKEIGDSIRKHFNRPKASPTTKVVTMEERKEAKAKAPATPRLASARIEGGEGQNKPKTTAEIIAKMQEARGQNSLSRR